ncbi:hypothetical protein PHYBOEH_001107 [Phytophthora boehmeriae]|uniref:Uncharacterized protein n=1 Tax=Phytophthora boehmeriae TaxID=109152 RepID=A0A8T1WZU1_9STRA|nr:hypothetical protein PHYBOEH_001107 [Phytophthora boehmeriae]
MEASDFVGDSDEDEQELLETHVDAEEDGSHQGDDAASSDTSVAAPDPVEAAQEPAQDEAEDKQTQEDEPATGLAVGDLVLVQSRTWPGINKLGGAGRVVRVHREANEAGEEELFYDVRYVLGGFEKHIESEFVQLSKLLEQDPSRETVEREYYHDDYINAPHLKKQQEAAKKRERAAAHPEEKEMLNKRRKRSHRAARAAREEDNVEEKAPGHRQEVHGDAEAVEVQTIREDTFIIQENKPSSLEESSRPLRGTERSTGRRREVLPTEMEPRAASLRRKNRIIVSSDEESSDDADKNGHEQNEEPGHSSEHVRGNPEVPYRAEQNLQPVGKRNLRHRHKRKRMRASKSRRYVGGYEQDGDDADATFIQPEGDPAELPEDVIRDTGLRLRTTKEGLKAQLHEVYTEQKKNMVYFQEEQKEINLKMSSLSGMPMSDLKNLHEKVTELSRYLTRTLVKGGEDVMNTIMEKLDKKYRELPGALQQLESDIEDNWMAKLKECDQWMRHVRGTVENAFVLREEQIPMEVAAQAEYSSDSGQSSYYPDDQEVSDLHGSDSDDIDLSFEYETSLQENVRLRNEKHRRNSNTGQRRSTTSTKRKNPQADTSQNSV